MREREREKRERERERQRERERERVSYILIFVVSGYFDFFDLSRVSREREFRT